MNIVINPRYANITHNPLCSVFQPPGDVFQITKQQLVDELRAVMSSTAKFSQYCIPLLIEKISSDLQSAKQDSFATLVSYNHRIILCKSAASL